VGRRIVARIPLREVAMNLKSKSLVVNRSRVLVLALMTLLCASGVAAQSSTASRASSQNDPGILQVPPGAILPVMLNHGFSAKNARAGQVITGRLMQDVPLPNADKIPAGAKILGTILSVTPPGNGGASTISFRFDRLESHHRKTAIVTNLRAIASVMEIESAQTPETPSGFGTPSTWLTTRQVGGDEVYGVGGPVTDESNHTVGVAVFDGVLVHVRARPGAQCRGALDSEDRLQPLWVFSSDACGVYGIPGVTIQHAGRSDPLGEIILTAATGDVRVRSGSGLLLRVVR
jgi:hypothetical protein